MSLMTYLINDQILFDPDAGTLDICEGGDEPVQISNPSRRLLLLLIQQAGETITRDQIFRKVWDDFGMVSSNNNLNQCVSKLRKILRNLGIEEEVIATVPKVGFMFREQISLQCRDAGGKNAYTFTPHAAAAALSRESQTRRRAAFVSWQRALSVVAVIALTITFSMVLSAWWCARMPAHSEQLLGQSGSCRVMLSLHTEADKFDKSMRQRVLQRMGKLNPACQRGEFLLVINSQSLRTPASDRLLFMRCSQLPGKGAETCWGLTNENPSEAAVAPGVP